MGVLRRVMPGRWSVGAGRSGDGGKCEQIVAGSSNTGVQVNISAFKHSSDLGVHVELCLRSFSAFPDTFVGQTKD